MSDNFTLSESRHASTLNYRAMIPFHVLFDLELTANALRLYGLIEQMESNQKKVRFTNKYLAAQLGVTERQVRNVSKELKDKKYIEHLQLASGSWIWRTRKSYPEEIVEEGGTPVAADEKGGGNAISGGGEVPLPGGGQSDFPHKYPIPNNQKINNNNIGNFSLVIGGAQESSPAPKPASSGFVISEEVDRELLIANRDQPMHAKDNREFLMWAKQTLETKIKANSTEDAIRILKSWIKGGGLRKPVAPVAPTAVFGETPSKPIEKPEFLYRGYLTSITTDKRFNLIPEDYQEMTFDQWIAAGSPARVNLMQLAQAK